MIPTHVCLWYPPYTFFLYIYPFFFYWLRKNISINLSKLYYIGKYKVKFIEKLLEKNDRRNTTWDMTFKQKFKNHLRNILFITLLCFWKWEKRYLSNNGNDIKYILSYFKLKCYVCQKQIKLDSCEFKMNKFIQKT